VSTEDSRVPTLAVKAIPVLLDVIDAGSGEIAAAHRLSADQRAALAAEAHYILDELLDECLPLLEARLRERLEQRVSALLGD
jgi:hypothetical protein